MIKRLALALIVCVLLPASAQAAISRVGSCTANTGTPASCTFSVAPSAGDAIVVMAYRAGNTAQPTIPSTYALLENVVGASVNSAVLGVRISDGTETSTGTGWTNATGIAASIYRGGIPAPIGIYASSVGASTSISYSAISMTDTSGNAWVVGFAGHRTATNVNQAPSGMTLVSGTASGTGNVAVSDTNAGVSSWAGGTVTVSASSGWYAYSVEILPLPTEAAGKLYVDNYLHMNVADANGTQLTPTILGNGNDGLEDPATCYVLNSPTTPTPSYTVSAHFQSALSTIHVRSPSTDYATSSTTKSVSIAIANTECRWEGLWSTRKRGGVTVAGWVAFPADVGVNGNIFDLWRLTTVDGNYCVMQLNDGNYNGNATGYGITAEVDADNNGTPEKIGLLTLSASTTYWVAIYCNWQSGVVKVAAYDTGGAQVGSTISGSIFLQSANGPYVDDIRIGNAEIGSSPHPTIKFEDIVVDYTGKFPFAPSSGAGSSTATRMLLGVGQ